MLFPYEGLNEIKSESDLTYLVIRYDVIGMDLVTSYVLCLGTGGMIVSVNEMMYRMKKKKKRREMHRSEGVCR